jgi:dTDP-4-dehydrorhamnose 3,5-epimerase
MKVFPTEIPDILLLKPAVHEDQRGFFLESYNKKTFSTHGISVDFVQDNHSRSIKNTLRGLHYQINPGQAKLVRVISGEVFDVAVDIRIGSPTFGKWVSALLSAANKYQLYIPVGFAHGFCVLSDHAEFEYKCSAFYSAEDERGIAWNDPDLNIDWPVNNPLLSEKDKKNPPFSKMENYFFYQTASDKRYKK